jgi:hypothetical protein
MKVYIKGRNDAIDLGQRNFIAGGGQGNVYARGGTGFKVYHDPKQMIPLGKIQELALMTDPHIVRPQDVLVDAQGNPVGYTTKFVDDAWVLCQLFPRVFRERNGLDHDAMKELIRMMREGIENAHQAKVLIVDLNEMNFLVGKKFDEVFFIDTDSYQTPHYPATAIMDSIRDWSIKGNAWSAASDWYSFGIVSFQMWTGIHPFKGKYKGPKTEFKTKLSTDDPNDAFAVTRRRMLANVSVFDPQVGVPDAAYPVNIIPKEYLQWYEAMFVQGKRCAPPSGPLRPVAVQAHVIAAVSGTANLDIAEVNVFQGTITGIWSDGHRTVVATDQGIYLDGQRATSASKKLAGFGFAPRSGRVVMMDATTDVPSLTNITDRVAMPFSLKCREATSYDGRLYVRTEERVHEVILTDMGAQTIASTKEVAQTMPLASHLFPGVVVQNLLGSTYVSLFAKSGGSQQVRMPSLDKYRVLDARYDSGVLMIIGIENGRYDRLVFRFNDEWEPEAPRIVSGIQPTGLNFVTLDSGVCVCLNEDEKLELFKVRAGSPGVKLIEDAVLGGDMILGKQGGKLLFGRGNKLYTMRMR